SMAWHAENAPEALRLAGKALEHNPRDVDALKLAVMSLERLGRIALAADLVESRWDELDRIEAQLVALETLEKAERHERADALRAKIEKEHREQLSAYEARRVTPLLTTAISGDAQAREQLTARVSRYGRSLPDTTLTEAMAALWATCQDAQARAQEIL